MQQARIIIRLCNLSGADATNVSSHLSDQGVLSLSTSSPLLLLPHVSDDRVAFETTVIIHHPRVRSVAACTCSRYSLRSERIMQRAFSSNCLWRGIGVVSRVRHPATPPPTELTPASASGRCQETLSARQRERWSRLELDSGATTPHTSFPLLSNYRVNWFLGGRYGGRGAARIWEGSGGAWVEICIHIPFVTEF